MKTGLVMWIPAGVTALSVTSAAVLMFGGLAACASAPMPTEQLAVAEAAVQRASSVSTRESAPAELGMAVDKLARARSAVQAGDAERARRLADEAALDAQVADIRAQTVRANLAARDSEAAARVLREELTRQTPR